MRSNQHVIMPVILRCRYEREGMSVIFEHLQVQKHYLFRMNHLQNLAKSRSELKEIQLFYKLALDKYRDDIPVDLLKEMTLELKRLREKYAEMPGLGSEMA